MNKRMKTKTLFTAAVVLATVCILAGCGSRKPQLLQSSNGGGKTPSWVQTWKDEANVDALENQYSGVYCFVVTDTGDNVDALKEWLNTIEINRQIASRIATRVEGIGKGISEIEGKSDYDRALKNITPVLQSATFTGVVRKGDYWEKMRYFDNPKKPEDKFNYYVLYTIEKKRLDKQIEAKLQEISKNPAAADERALATELINAIQKDGLGIETPAPASAPKASFDASVRLN